MIIVTGGAGFIGSNLAAALEAAGEHVVISDWLGTGDKWRNIAKRSLEDCVRPEDLPAFLEKHKHHITMIYHLGAISATTATDGDEIIKNNFRLSKDLWQWCTEHHVSFIYASSAATYGDGSAEFDDSDDPDYLARLRPLNLYGWSKHLFDRWIVGQRDIRSRPTQYVGLKFFNVYGPNEYHKDNMRSVVHQVFPFAQRGESFPLFKSHRPDYQDGGQLRDFIWVGDVINVMLWLRQNPRVNGLFNVGTGQARSFADLGAAVYRAAGREPMLTYRDMPETLREKYQYFTQAKMDKLAGAGYDVSHMTSLEEGIRRYVQDYMMQPDQYV
ncbi:MAG: ADP-glyceromanno-heptose 6-epimerase [Alphaproteobacteria bacterium]